MGHGEQRRERPQGRFGGSVGISALHHSTGHQQEWQPERRCGSPDAHCDFGSIMLSTCKADEALGSVQKLTDMLKAVEDVRAGLADIEAGRAEAGKDKRASFVNSGIEKVKRFRKDLTEAAVQIMTARDVACPVF